MATCTWPPSFFGGIDCSLKRLRRSLRQSKYTDDIYTIGDGLLNEVLYHVIGIMIVAKYVLSSEEHLSFVFLKPARSLRSLSQGSSLRKRRDASKVAPPPALYRIVADLIHLLHYGKHLLGRHTCGDKGLMGITKDGLNYLYRLFFPFQPFYLLQIKFMLLSRRPGPLREGFRLTLLKHPPLRRHMPLSGPKPYTGSFFYSKHCHEGTGCYRSTYNACHIGSHGMHKYEVRGIILSRYLLGYTGRHGYRRYSR